MTTIRRIFLFAIAVVVLLFAPKPRTYSQQKFSKSFCEAVHECRVQVDYDEDEDPCYYAQDNYEWAMDILSTNEAGTCGLSPEELTVLNLYHENGHFCFNPHLWKIKVNPKYDPLIKILDTALAKLPSYKGFLRRGTHFPDHIANQHVEGSIINYAAFTSTSTSREGETEDERFDVRKDQLLIYSNTGSLVMGFADEHEYEVLFRSNRNFKVVKVIRIGKKSYYILNEVGSNLSDEQVLTKVRESIKSDDTSQPKADFWKCPSEVESFPKEVVQKHVPNMNDFKVMWK